MYRECSECGRQIPFDETEECDLCGKQGAFTFSTGDCMCNDCAFGEPPTSGESGSAAGCVEWISVKDKMPVGQWAKNFPHLSENVLVANSCAIEIAFYDRDDGVWYVGEPRDEEWIDKITHWMPLPKNPNYT